MGADEVAERNQQKRYKTLAEKLDHLFATVRPPGGSELTLEQVADAINQRGEVKLTPVYVSQLRRGQRTNPTVGVLEALAGFSAARLRGMSTNGGSWAWLFRVSTG